MANTVTAGQVSWADAEISWGHVGELGWADFETPLGYVGELGWAQLQVPLVATAGQIGWADIETPFVPTAGQISQAWLQLNPDPTGGRLSFAVMEVPILESAGQIGQAFLILPKSWAQSFSLSNGTVDIYRTANLSAVQAAGQIVHVDVTSSGTYYTDANDIVVTAEHSTNTPGAQDASLQAVIGALTTKAGSYRTTKGFLSSDKYLQNEDYYNEHTYVVRVAESFDRWETIFKKVIHPAGFRLIGEFVSTDTPTAFTVTPVDAIVT